MPQSRPPVAQVERDEGDHRLEGAAQAVARGQRHPAQAPALYPDVLVRRQQCPELRRPGRDLRRLLEPRGAAAGEPSTTGRGEGLRDLVRAEVPLGAA